MYFSVDVGVGGIWMGRVGDERVAKKPQMAIRFFLYGLGNSGLFA